MEHVELQPRRFYDGGLLPGRGTDGMPPDPGQDPRIVLERHTEGSGRTSRRSLETFSLERRIGYRDRHFGEILVPADEAFRTDLTSVPQLFTWLVPKTGAHLPAALIHDALIPGRDGASYESTDGHHIDRVEADRVFRDAMADTGTPLVRRWLVWAAVSMATMVHGGGTTWSRARLWGHRVAVVGTIAVITWLGWCALWDLADRSAPLALQVPWMGDRSTPVEFVGGLAGAIAIPFGLGFLWGRFRVAGWICGVALAVLLPATAVLVAVTLLYRGVESLTRRVPMVALGLGVLVVVLAIATTIGLALT